ncbi:MAG TPA: hypothetical protein VFT12_11790 [Thermoanaerobaculia bacterium]|nr:hypothetical protein [Thermoanaerobaculia bacterium]
MRTLTFAVSLLLSASAAPAGEIVIRSDAGALDLSQRRFIHAFVGGAAPQQLASLAGYANLPGAAAYLRAADDRSRERLWKHAAGEPIVIVVRDDRREIGIAVEEQEWLDYLVRNHEEFEKTMPGFSESWLATTAPLGRFTFADLVWRKGATLSPGTYPPFDASLRPELGRSYVFWKNVLESSWFGRQIYPAAREAFHDSALRELKPEGLSRWYATRFLMDRIGAEVAGDVPLRETMGDLYDPLSVAKADVLAPIAAEWLAEKGLRPRAEVGEDAVAAAAMSFYALADVKRGGAPAAHETASKLVLAWLHREKALRQDRATKKWMLDLPRLMPAFRSLAAEILRAEASGDPAAVAKLFDANPMPKAMERAIEAMAKVPRESNTARFESQGVLLP